MDYFASGCVELGMGDWGEIVDSDYSLYAFRYAEWADVAGLDDDVGIEAADEARDAMKSADCFRSGEILLRNFK